MTLCAVMAFIYFGKKRRYRRIPRRRYFCDYTAESLTAMLEKTGLFEILEVWETDDVRSSHPDTVWVNLLARKR